MKSILLTGGTGFIGNNLINSLKGQFKIFVLKRNNNKTSNIKNDTKLTQLNYSKINEIENLIRRKKITYLINLATHYTNKNDTENLIKIVNSNILFSSVVLNSLNKRYLKKVISIGTMHEHFNNKFFVPFNLYAASKRAFYDIVKFYELKYPKIKFYNLKFYETFSEHDKRNKIIPALITSIKNNKPITLSSSKLRLNFIHVDDVISAIHILLKKEIISGEYQIKSSSFTNIKKLINNININLTKKIKIKIKKEKLSIINYNLKKLPYWKQTTKIEKFLKEYFYEKN